LPISGGRKPALDRWLSGGEEVSMFMSDSRPKLNFPDDLDHPIRHTFENLSKVPDLLHGVFTRHGGVSRQPYATLNTAWNDGDAPEAVRENLIRVRGAMGVERLVASKQTHGDTIHVVDEECLARATARHPVLFTPPGDALVTNLRGVGLLIKIADCQAIFLVDPVREVIANVHCGWRGSVRSIPEKVVAMLRDRFGTKPEDLLAGISPSLGPCCAEFRNYSRELPAPLWSFQTKAEHFDFWAISRWQLMKAGLRPDRIEIANRCTVCESGDFFSYRGERTTGRNGAVLAWRNNSRE
jgi:polyphenol oxidase